MYQTSSTILLKSRIVEESIKQQQKVIDDYRIRIDRMIANEVNKKVVYDSHLHSFKGGNMAEISLLSQQLQLVNHELEHLMHVRNYEYEPHRYAEYGTVVITDKETFFISVGVEMFYVNNSPVIGLSVQSPVYTMMKGKQAGDSFTYQGRNYLIEEIF